MRRLLAVVVVCVVVPVGAVAATPTRVIRASVSVRGADPDGGSRRPDLSAGGQIVVFEFTATNLAADANSAVGEVFRHDRRTGATTLVSEAPDGRGANGPSGAATIARDNGLVV